MRYVKFALVAVAGLLVSCEDYYAEKDAEADGSNPYISISAPGQNTVFNQNQSIKLESLLSDKDQVKKIEVQIVSLNKEGQDNETLVTFNKFPKKNPVVLDTTISTAELPAGDYLLILNGTDGRANMGTKEVNFSVK
jgi:hypothetical protein